MKNKSKLEGRREVNNISDLKPMLLTHQKTQRKPKIMVLVCFYDGKDSLKLEFGNSCHIKAMITMIAKVTKLLVLHYVSISKRQMIRKEADIKKACFKAYLLGLSIFMLVVHNF